MPPLFRLIQEYGGIADEEMRRVFNLGIGMVLVARADGAEELLRLLEIEGGERTQVIGKIVQ